MKVQKIKFTAMLSATLFGIAAFVWLAPVAVSAQIILKPGEIVYGRQVTNPGSAPPCVTASVWAVGQDGSNDRLLFSDAVHPRISPDGRFIMYKRFPAVGACTPFQGGDIRLRELATGREILVLPASLSIYGTFFTPETNRADNQIIYDSLSLCRINLDGTNRMCSNLGIQQQNYTHPTVRGGDYLGVVAGDSTVVTVGGLYTFNYNLTNAQRIPNTSRLDRSPTWSNDGQTIAYGFDPATRGYPYFFTDLYKINPDGSNKTRLTFLNPPLADGFTYGMVWTNNSFGDEFIFTAARINGVAGIYRIAADGSGTISQIPITAGNRPDWIGGIVPVRSEQQTASFGGGITSSGNYSLVSTIGQAFTGQISAAAPYRFESGFWAIPSTARRPQFDYDGDGKTDLSVFRPSQGAWYLQRSTAGFFGMLFGFSTDKITPADFDGDGKTDIAVFRPSDQRWYIANSSNGTFSTFVFGLSNDVPAPADYDGDGRADLCVFRPSDGTWYRQNSSNGSFFAYQFGANGDKPTVGDFDGDGKSDLAVFRTSNGEWYQVYSSDGSIHGEQFGFSTDKLVYADYDGDGKTDMAVFRPSERIFYIKNSATSTYSAFVFGLSDDIPTPGDYDGDGKADLSVFRPSDGNWYRQNSSNGTFNAFNFGLAGDKPTPTAFH